MAKGIHTFFLLMTTATLVIVLFSTWTNETFSRHQPCGVTDADTTSLLMTPADDSAALLSRHEDHVVPHSDVRDHKFHVRSFGYRFVLCGSVLGHVYVYDLRMLNDQ